MTKRVTIEKSKLFFVIPKIISVIPYPCNYLVSYPLSLKLFCQLSLIPKTPIANRTPLVPREKMRDPGNKVVNVLFLLLVNKAPSHQARTGMSQKRLFICFYKGGTIRK